MIKKIEIKNYGPFLDTQINLENDKPISILGQNDVGKTALLKLIAWNIKKIDKSNNKSIYLWEEYKRKNRDGNFISPQITITYTLFLNKKWQKHGLEEVSKLEFQVEIIKDGNIVQFNPNGKDIFCYEKHNENNEDNKDNKLLEDFFTSIYEEFKNIGLNGFDNLNNENLTLLKDQTTNNKIIEKIEFLIELRKNISETVNKKIEFLSIDINSDYRIKDYYSITQDKEEIQAFLTSFLKNENSKDDFDKIFSDNLDENTIRQKISLVEKEFNKEIKDFFENYFPFENPNIDFQFDIDHGRGQLSLRCRDDTGEYYEPLSRRSDGFKWILNLFLSLRTIDENSILIIDEPERFVQPYIQKKLVELMNETKEKYPNAQIIYSTHSPFMISKDFFPSLKIVTKENDGSKIHNNISSFVQQSKQPKENRNVLLPILNIFGLDDDEYINILKSKKVLFVEGEADYWTIEIAKCMNEELKNKMNEFCVLPLLGKDNLFIVNFLINKEIDYLIFLDEEPDNKGLSDEVYKEITNKLFCLDKLPSNNNKQSGNNSKIIEPEKMLSEKTFEEYKFQTEKGNNHKNAWRNLFSDIRDKKYELKNGEKELFEEYAELINNHL